MEQSKALPGIERLLFNREAGSEDLRAPYLCSGLRYALLFADALIPLLDTEFGVSISAFNNAKDSGLFFHEEVHRLAAKVMSHPVAGGPMLYIGRSEDFEFPSRLAKDNLEPICFEEAEIPKYALVVAQHFATQTR